MSLVEIFKSFGDTVSDFVNWKGSGFVSALIFMILLLIVFADPIIRFFVEVFYRYEDEEKKDNDR